MIWYNLTNTLIFQCRPHHLASSFRHFECGNAERSSAPASAVSSTGRHSWPNSAGDRLRPDKANS
jgi:hypothetical protein